MSDPITVLVVDDHPIVRKGLRTLLLSEADIQTVYEAENGLQAIQILQQHRPTVILMDLVMSPMSGVEAIARIKAIQPSARILVLTAYAEDDKVFPAIKAGASGYVLKDIPPEELIQAIRDVANGQCFLHPTIAARLMREITQVSMPVEDSEPLTEREVEVLRWIARGLSNQEIAARLHVSERTITTHISNILDKLHLANRTQATLYALRKGIASLYEDEDTFST
ncbi:MAG: response regulator transcription factor [Anaerolineales bacterium]|nr:response regulator transcription factor [Anaerolineales bacterium]MCS7247625.1 response regulator transcription factor [Anaerolineales bacterium]MDW8161436.1 response regulator transcription factor [Anaerolineales bacterium]MDW8446567.1 response regulator transcription factor [Anaerolineales bacterium]